MKRIRLAIMSALLLAAGMPAGAQISSNLRISEVVVDNPSGLVDEYGERHAWIEIDNTSWGTVNLRSCYLTNDRRATEDMSVPERMKLMWQIPRGDKRTSLKAQECATFFADGETNLGTFHASFRLTPGKENFIALFDGDGHTLIDSVTVPASLPAGCSWARAEMSDGKAEWVVCLPEKVTPDYPNSHVASSVNKIEEFKQKDPYGFGMAILGIGIVFLCLSLLAVFFYIFGKLFEKNGKKPATPAAFAAAPAASKPQSGNDEEVVAAVIALALSSELDAHDEESGVITIKPRRTAWSRTGASR